MVMVDANVDLASPLLLRLYGIFTFLFLFLLSPKEGKQDSQPDKLCDS